jgi:Flp pilus assembly protein TadD
MYDDALKEVDEVLAACPEHKDSLYWKGLIYLDQHKFTEAEPPLRRLIEIDAEQAHVYVHLAYIYRRTVSLERAIETIQQALQLSPKMPIGLYNLACYRAVQGQPTEALKLLSQAVTLSKEYRKLALTDPDFESVRGTEEFRKLIEN